MDLAIDIVTLVVALLACWLAWRAGAARGPDAGAQEAMRALEQGVRAEFASSRQESGAGAAALRTDVMTSFHTLSNALGGRFETFTQTLQQHRESAEGSAAQLRQRIGERLETLETQQAERLKAMEARLAKLAEDTDKRAETLRATLEGQLTTLRTENDAKLEQMRATVEEKLQATLNERLGASFKQVSERLEQVHKGLGDMQSLASGVGDLKKVLTNVKSRGTWGETMLGALPEDLLRPEQLVANFACRPGSAERVEFAVKMPGRGDGTPVHLPIDAKFPMQAYEQLLAAQDAADREACDRAAAALERRIRLEAERIAEKYINPGVTTDFAILYLPTEGLFAEVVRRPGLLSDLQSGHRVMVTGPTTLAALLSSLQMGFRTLAIEQRSAQIGEVLQAVRSEFARYGQAWVKVVDRLDSARRAADQVGVRTRAVERTLRQVGEGEGTVMLVGLDAEDDTDPDGTLHIDDAMGREGRSSLSR